MDLILQGGTLRHTIGNSIGSRLIYIREDESRASFANRIGVHKNTLGNYERDDRSPDAEFLGKLHRLGFNINWIVSGEGQIRLPLVVDDACLDAEKSELYLELVDGINQLLDKVALTATTSNLTADEHRWLEWYRKIPSADRTLVEPMLERFAERGTENQRETI